MNWPLAIYNIAQAASAPAALPAGLVFSAMREKYRKQLAERLSGWKRCRKKVRAPFLWIHTLSYGEVNAAVPLIRAARERWPDMDIICSGGTASGFELLRSRLEGTVSCITYLPYDIYPFCNRVARAVTPACFVLVETDVWPNWLWSLKRHDSRILFVNAAISRPASSRVSRFPCISRLLYGAFDVIAAQSHDDLDRFRMTVPEDVSLVHGGNLKFDIPIPGDRAELNVRVREMLGFGMDDMVLVAGSTHEGEEQVLAEVFSSLSSRFPDAGFRLIVAPRDPSRSGEVVMLFAKKGFFAVKRTGIPGMERRPDVVVLDTMGELARCYAAAFLAFVGGTLVPVGGHNLLEPAALEVPVMFGPFVESCREAADAMSGCGAGWYVSSAADMTAIAERLVNDEEFSRAAGCAARRLVEENRGTVRRYIELMEENITGFPA